LFVFTFQTVEPIAVFEEIPRAVLMAESGGVVIEIPAVTFKVITTASDIVAATTISGSKLIYPNERIRDTINVTDTILRIAVVSIPTKLIIFS
jgi:hypothetical protein